MRIATLTLRKPVPDRRGDRALDGDLVLADGLEHVLGQRGAVLVHHVGAGLGDLPLDVDAGGLDHARHRLVSSGPMPSPGMRVTVCFAIRSRFRVVFVGLISLTACGSMRAYWLLLAPRFLGAHADDARRAPALEQALAVLGIERHDLGRRELDLVGRVAR